MAIMFVDTGQAHLVDVWDPSTRDDQVTDYYGAWGSSSTAPAVNQTALGSENAESREACIISQPSANTLRFLFEIEATGNRTVNEFGIFTASSSGTMLTRGTHATLNIETGDRVEYTIDHVVSDVSEI